MRLRWTVKAEVSNDGVPVTMVSIVSEDAHFRESVKALVESAGLRANTFPTLQALLGEEKPQPQGCLLFHAEKNALNDPAQQAWLRAACAGWSGILITERGNIRTAVQALKAGIRDVVESPYRDKQLLERIVTLCRPTRLPDVCALRT